MPCILQKLHAMFQKATWKDDGHRIARVHLRSHGPQLAANGRRVTSARQHIRLVSSRLVCTQRQRLMRFAPLLACLLMEEASGGDSLFPIGAHLACRVKRRRRWAYSCAVQLGED